MEPPLAAKVAVAPVGAVIVSPLAIPLVLIVIGDAPVALIILPAPKLTLPPYILTVGAPAMVWVAFRFVLEELPAPNVMVDPAPNVKLLAAPTVTVPLGPD